MGGVLVFNTYTQTFDVIKDSDGLDNLDFSLIGQDKYENIWLGGTDGSLQIYHQVYGLKENINNLATSGFYSFDIGDSISFVAYKNGNESGVLKFSMDNDEKIPVFEDYFRYFPIELTSINDIGHLNDSLYIATNNGLLIGNYKEDILNFSQFWDSQIENSDIKQIEFDGNDIWTIVIENDTTNKLILNFDIIETFNEPIIDFQIIDSSKFILTSTQLHFLYGQSFSIPENYETTFTSMLIDENYAYCGLHNHGIMILDLETGESEVYVPNTLMTNSFEALTFTEDNILVGVGIDGLFMMDVFDEFSHMIPMNQPAPFPINIVDNTNHFYGSLLDFKIVGTNPLFSIIETNNGNLLFGNKGTKPHDDDPINRGAVVEINPNTFEFSIYDTTNQIIDGQDGIYTPNWNVQYMVISQIEKDPYGNTWMLNPMGEFFGNMLSIQYADGENWSHVKQPDEHSYWANSIAFDNSNRAWFGIRGGWGNYYTTGGLRVLKYSSNLDWDEGDTTWVEINNQSELPGGSLTTVFSCVIDKRNDLWVLTGDGVQGYSISGSNSITLSPLNTYYDYLYYASFEMGDRIRVDSQNNKWIVTHNGVWVIQDNHTFWPDESGINTSNSELLSDFVMDIAFDEEYGYAYFATNKGISKFNIPFSNSGDDIGDGDDGTSGTKIKLSNNPYLIPKNNNVEFKITIPFDKPVIKIMQLNGRVLIEKQIQTGNKWIDWDGRNSEGEYLSSGVYLVTASNKDGKIASTKLAIIRK